MKILEILSCGSEGVKEYRTVIFSNPMTSFGGGSKGRGEMILVPTIKPPL